MLTLVSHCWYWYIWVTNLTNTTHDCNLRYQKIDYLWHTVNSLKQKMPLRFFEHLSIDMSSIRKCNNKRIFLWPFFGICFLVDQPFQMGSTLTANIQQMWISDQGKTLPGNYQPHRQYTYKIWILYAWYIWRYW